jgi:hypothetical protein
MNRTEYLFVKLMEESSEVAQEAAKCLCFGANEVYELIGIPNMGRVKVEFNDLLAVIEMLQERGALPKPMIDRGMIETKKLKLEKYMLYSTEIGTLEPAK